MIDFEFLRKRVDEDVTVMNELLSVFLSEFERLLTEIQHSQSPQRQAHSIKGMCRELGATELAELCQQIEQGDNLQAHIPALVESFPVIKKQIAAWQVTAQ